MNKLDIKINEHMGNDIVIALDSTGIKVANRGENGYVTNGMSAEDFVIKDNLGILVDNSAQAIQADPVRKHMIISSLKEDFINHDLRATTHNVERLPTKIAIKYNLPLSIAKEVAGHIITDRRSVVDIEPIMDTVFVYYRKE